MGFGRFSRQLSRGRRPRVAIDLYAMIRRHGPSALAVGGLVGAVVLVIVLLGVTGVLDLDFVVQNWGTLWGPALTSLELTMASFLLGFALAIPLGLVRAYVPVMFRRAPKPIVAGPSVPAQLRANSRRRPSPRGALRKALLAPAYGLATGYVEAIRGTPFYVQMWVVFYLVSFTWPRLPNLFFVIGVIVLTLSTVGYQTEVLRAGFQSVGQGQIEAAKSIGMRGRQILAHITLPQALRLVVLPLTNEWIGLFKISAILNFISVRELMFQAYDLGSNKAHPIEAFLMVAVMYCAILIPLSRILTYVENKKRIPGLGGPVEQPRRARQRTPVTA
jgi:ABC-type amino acid transport system permease subunit